MNTNTTPATNTRNFPTPGVYPFWFWNGDQCEPEVRRQVALFAQASCKGVVIHSRTGNKTPYLSEKWFSLFRAACDECAKFGLKVWIYDEDGYPSGNAGHTIEQLRPDLRQKTMVYAYDTTDPTSPAYAAFDVATFTPIDEVAKPAGTKALRFRIVESTSHVDVLNRETTDLFLQLTHERYAAELGDLFGGTIQAVYTDDISSEACGIAGFAWSPTLEAEWNKRYPERPLKTVLPMLVEEIGDFKEIRCAYRDLVNELFLDNFVGPQRDWCEAHNLIYLGHLCGDEGPMRIALKQFGSHGRFYMREDIPSIDAYLCDRADLRYLKYTHNDNLSRLFRISGINRKFPCLLPYLYAGSISRLFKGGLFSDETLTFIGWEAPASFQDTQMLTELALGVNLLTPHAYYYVVDDVTRRDCPPSYFFQQPYFPMLGDLQRKWTHIAELLMQTVPVGDTLMISASAVRYLARGRDNQLGWMEDVLFVGQNESSEDKIGSYEQVFMDTALALLRQHIGFEVLEEVIFAPEIVPGEGIKVGNRIFRNIVIPPIIPLEEHTLQLLKDSGAQILDSNQINQITPDFALPTGMEETLVRPFKFNGKLGAFLVNLSGQDLAFPLQRDSAFKLYDPATRKVFFEGTKLPEGAILRKGSAVFVMPTDFDAPRISFENSPCAAVSTWTPLANISMSTCEEHGRSIYEYAFSSEARLLRIELIDGMAEVYLNSERLGVVSSDPWILSIPEGLTHPDGQNILRVHYAETAQPYESTNPPKPMGIASIAIA